MSDPEMLVEPTNDLDTDILAAIEDLLDSWPGTLIVVSHDRYLLERVTDQQYAILDGHLRQLPGGVDEYLKLRRAQQAADASPATAASVDAPQAKGATSTSSAALTGAERRAAEKEIASIDRRIGRLQGEIAAAHDRLAAHDQSDYVGLGELTEALRALETELAELETRWLELSEQLEG
ncbi:hypothetical protein GCM10022288_06410 [Gryllotalpicola kribbensis]|uniref:ABC transporter Uup C-terminal domain-containing protein n=1 Tax=Gryllotalpicola kribbensis TaxID=993084 RepID=A0ABP8AJH4_9MICO